MNILDNKFVSIAIIILVGLYAQMLGPDLPQYVKDLFKSTVFRIIVLFFVLVRANKDPALALIIVIAFVLTLEYINLSEAKEMFNQPNRVGRKIGHKR